MIGHLFDRIAPWLIAIFGAIAITCATIAVLVR